MAKYGGPERTGKVLPSSRAVPRVLVLGVDGMLGSMVARVLAANPSLKVSGTTRREGAWASAEFNSHRFNAINDALGALLDSDAWDWVVNALGVLKPVIDERDPLSVENALRINSLLPHRLAAESARRGQRVIQIATDGVYSGAGGPYDELAAHDALDVYGKTKSLGEVRAPSMIHLRCSIIGPELTTARSFLAWALSSPVGARLSGYTAQQWNGITTLHFAKICAGVIAGAEVDSPQHIVPADSVSKAELLELALAEYGRDDVVVRREPGPSSVDRRLTTTDRDANRRLWRAAGYGSPPTIATMLHELASTQIEPRTGAS